MAKQRATFRSELFPLLPAWTSPFGGISDATLEGDSALLGSRLTWRSFRIAPSFSPRQLPTLGVGAVGLSQPNAGAQVTGPSVSSASRRIGGPGSLRRFAASSRPRFRFFFSPGSPHIKAAPLFPCAAACAVEPSTPEPTPTTPRHPSALPLPGKGTPSHPQEPQRNQGPPGLLPPEGFSLPAPLPALVTAFLP